MSNESFTFVSPLPLITRVRSRLKSFDAAGLVDEGEFYDWIKYLMDYMNIAGHLPQTAIAEIRNRQVALPINFSFIYAGYHAVPEFQKNERYLLGGSIVTVEKEVESTCEPLVPCEPIYEKCTIKTKYFVNGCEENVTFGNLELVKLSSQVPKVIVDDQCLSLASRSRKEIFINRLNRSVTTNFNGWLILMYYGFPVDKETGLPAIPDNEIVQLTIEYYLIKRQLEMWWLNSAVPDIERRLQYFSEKFDQHLSDAQRYLKTPSFQTLLNLGHRRRSLLDKYQLNTKQYW